VPEDALLGVEAARRAGMRALTTSLPAAAFTTFSNPIGVAGDLRACDLDTLLRDPTHA
jgi:beta-phosphoglucomutase-like phosphatase (HAD superfamily)